MTTATSYLCLVLVALALVSPSLCYPRQQGLHRRPIGRGMQGQVVQGGVLPGQVTQGQDMQDDRKKIWEQEYNQAMEYQADQKNVETDPVYAFEVSAGDLFQPDRIYVLIGDNGKFVSRITRGSVQYMEAEKTTIDYFCILRASFLSNGKLSLTADNGNYKYLSRITRGGVDNIEAAKDSIDIYSQFTVEIDWFHGKWDGAAYIYLKADNDKYVGIQDRNGRNNLEASFTSYDDATRFTLLEVF